MDAKDPQPKPRGRPKADEPGSTASTWLTTREHDRLIQLANKRDLSLSSLIRQLLVQRLP